MERDSQSPQIRIRSLTGLQERTSKALLPLGAAERLEGLYPAQTGLLERIPTHRLLRVLHPAGNLASTAVKVLNLHPTYDRYQNIIIQTDQGLELLTLDQILNRNIIAALTYPPIDEEETMSQAIYRHTQPTGTSGGTLQGVGEVVNVFYPLVITEETSDPSGIGSLSTVGVRANAGANPTPGRITLGTGTYRIKVWQTVGSLGSNEFATMRLYNNSTASTQNYKGTALPIYSPKLSGIAAGRNITIEMQGRFEVTAGTEVFQIEMAMDTVGPIDNADTLGNDVSPATTNVYCLVEILKEA